jgi:Ca2+-dependent lipid-binding protein
LDKLRAHVKERAHARLIAFQSSRGRTSETIQQVVSRKLCRQLTGLDATSDIQLLVEIVSATDLPIADRKSTDPYVIVYLGKQEIHRTKPIHKSLNPVWTVDNGSLFIMSASAEEFFSNVSGLTFVLKDYDALSSNEVLFKLEVAQVDLLALDGERTSFNLQILQPDKFLMSSKHFKPKLQLRVRPAENEDRRFMKQVFAIKKSKKLGIYADSSFVAPKVERMGLLKREKKMMDGIQLVCTSTTV